MWIFNIINHEYNHQFNLEEMLEFCVRNDLQYVPLIPFKDKTYNGKLSELGSTVQELVEFSKGKSVINPKIEREGIVIRCVENGNKVLSFKVINPNFLLKNEN
jgi:hypothetical protein